MKRLYQKVKKDREEMHVLHARLKKFDECGGFLSGHFVRWRYLAFQST